MRDYNWISRFVKLTNICAWFYLFFLLSKQLQGNFNATGGKTAHDMNGCAARQTLHCRVPEQYRPSPNSLWKVHQTTDLGAVPWHESHSASPSAQGCFPRAIAAPPPSPPFLTRSQLAFQRRREKHNALEAHTECSLQIFSTNVCEQFFAFYLAVISTLPPNPPPRQEKLR